jgi:hypothetical protein
LPDDFKVNVFFDVKASGFFNSAAAPLHSCLLRPWKQFEASRILRFVRTISRPCDKRKVTHQNGDFIFPKSIHGEKASSQIGVVNDVIVN